LASTQVVLNFDWSVLGRRPEADSAMTVTYPGEPRSCDWPFALRLPRSSSEAPQWAYDLCSWQPGTRSGRCRRSFGQLYSSHKGSGECRRHVLLPAPQRTLARVGTPWWRAVHWHWYTLPLDRHVLEYDVMCAEPVSESC